jgi:CheY-like chemotaxis protein
MSATGGSNLEGRRVLLVEDMLVAAMAMEEILAKHRCETVGPVGSLGEAMRLAREEALDGALLDINLKGEMVYPAASELVARGVPIIFLTGYDAADELPDEYRDHPFLEKPVDLDRLEHLMLELFGGSR